MPTIDEAKTMARRLRVSLAASGRDIATGTPPVPRSKESARLSPSRSAYLSCAVLPSYSVAPSIVVSLGFAVDFEHRFGPNMPLYLGLRMGQVLLHMSENPGDAVPGTSAFFWITGVDAYRDRILASGESFAVPEIYDQPWGREIGFIDPFGNRLRFCERPA